MTSRCHIASNPGGTGKTVCSNAPYILDSPAPQVRDDRLEGSEEQLLQIVDIDDITPSVCTTSADTPGHIPFDLEQVRTQITSERKSCWPQLSYAAASTPALQPYTQCVNAAAYNFIGPRVQNTTCNIDAWKRHATNHPDDLWLIECVSYGFPLQYHGPPLSSQFLGNHPSATAYDQHVAKYITKEKSLGAIIGPFKEPPFTPWCNIAPLMSREKTNSPDRRIIVDLSFPPNAGQITSYRKIECLA